MLRDEAYCRIWIQSKWSFDILSGTYLDYIKKYKDHNAILIWDLEMNTITTEWFGGDNINWYST